MVGLLDFRFHSKSGPFANQPLFDNSKSKLGRISVPHEVDNVLAWDLNNGHVNDQYSDVFLT